MPSDAQTDSSRLTITPERDPMFFRFALYGFLKNLRFFEPYLILFFRDAGLPFLQIGILYGIRDLGTSILELPASMLADTFGRRGAMVMSFVVYILSFLIFFTWPSFWPFALAMLLFAMGEALRTGTHKALILEHLRLNNMSDAKVAYYGRTRAASQLGSALNALLAAGLVFISGSYRYVFAAAAIPYVLDLINLLGYPRALDGEIIALAGDNLRARLRITFREFLGVFRSPQALRAIFNSSGFDAFFKATKDYLQPLLQAIALALPLLLTWQDTQRTAVLVGLVYAGTGHQRDVHARRDTPVVGWHKRLGAGNGCGGSDLCGLVCALQLAASHDRVVHQRSDSPRGDGIRALGRVAGDYVAHGVDCPSLGRVGGPSWRRRSLGSDGRGDGRDRVGGARS